MDSGKLNVKHMLQIRTLRQTRRDSAYCNDLFKYFKGVILELAVVIRDTNPSMVARFISMDDKAKVIIYVVVIVDGVDALVAATLVVVVVVVLVCSCYNYGCYGCCCRCCCYCYSCYCCAFFAYHIAATIVVVDVHVVVIYCT